MSDTPSRRWMTYREIAEALGLPSAKAGEARARRAKWERQIGNDGFARVAVPVSILEEMPPPRHRGATPSPTEQQGNRPYEGPTTSQEIKALRAELKALHEGAMQEALRRASAAEAKLAEVEREASDLRASSAAAQAEASALRTEAAGLRSDAAGLRERVEREQVLAAEARNDRAGAIARIEEMQAALARLTVELEEARLPWWRRALFRRG
jgi:hypothetical protein